MQSIYDYFASKNVLWDPPRFADSLSFNVSEVWQEQVQGPDRIRSVRHRQISNERLSCWLKETNGSMQPKANATSQQHRCVSRIVWITLNSKQKIHEVSPKLFQSLLGAFQHHLARKYLEASFGGVGSLPSTHGDDPTYFFCNRPKTGITWSQDGSSSVVNVICVAEPGSIQVLRDLLECKFIQALMHLVLTPALLCALLCSKEIDERLIDAKQQVREVEVRSGHHQFANRRELPASGDLFTLWAKMSGYATKVAATARNLGLVNEVIRFIDLEAKQNRKDHNMLALKSNAKVVKQRLAMQQPQVRYVQYRIHTQRDAIFHLITETSTVSNLEIAKNSLMLSLSTQHDSTSMNNLALLNTFFVPGMFVATFFSMPVFDWGASSTSGSGAINAIKISDPRLLLYLIVTGSLMLVIFLAWGVRMFQQRSKRKRQLSTTDASLAPGLQTSEVRALALKHLSAIATPQVTE